MTFPPDAFLLVNAPVAEAIAPTALAWRLPTLPQATSKNIEPQSDKPILIRGAKQVLTLQATRRMREGPRRGKDLGELGIIYDGAVLVRGGVVEELGPSRRVENLAHARNAIEVNAAGRIVMPGFVDSHTHIAFPPSGAGTGDAGSELHTVMTASHKLLAARMRPSLEAMARHGTTTLEAKCALGGNESAELKVLRSLTELSAVPVDLLPTYLMGSLSGPAGVNFERTSDATRITGEFLPLVARRKLAVCADLEWDPEPALYPIFLHYLEAARELGLNRKLQDSNPYPSGSVLAAVENGALSIDHLTRIDAFEVELLARSSTMVTLLPATILFGGTRPAPARQMVDSGIAVVLASNFNPQESPILNMQTVVWLACRHLKMTPAEAIAAATINGAHALGLGKQVGSLARGKPADLQVLNVADYQELGQRLGSNLVYLTMKAGEFIYREGPVKPSAGKNSQL